MNLIQLIKFICSHPLNSGHKLKSLNRFFKWQINNRLSSYPIIYRFTEKAKLIVGKGMTGATQNLYCGLHEYNDMGFLLHFLREEDLFVDVGANIGSYTVLASGHVGSETLSFEPVPATYNHLKDNIAINHIADKVTAFNNAVGSSKSYLNFTQSLDTVNHVACEDEKDVIKVPVEKLDDILKDRKCPTLMKIDVEGFETEVIRGAERTLSQKELKAIIIELNGSGRRYNYDESAIHKTLLGYDFHPFQYFPKERMMKEVDHFGTHNTIYVRDADFVKHRISSAEKVKVLTEEF